MSWTCRYVGLISFFLFQWLPLEDVKSGRLHVKLECLAPMPSAAELEQVMGVMGKVALWDWLH